MKRKVNRVGQNTLTVSLPAKWVKSHKVKPGAEIELVEDGNKLIISSEVITKNNEITITIPDNVRFLNRFILIPYVKGYDSICVKYADSKIYDKILSASRLLLGFEIIENSKNSCKLVNVSTKLEQDFMIILGRLFSCGITFSQELLSRLENQEYDNLNGLFEYESNVNRLTLFCRRILQTGNHDNQVYSNNTLYSIVTHLEETSDCFRQIVEYVTSENIKLRKETLELLNCCIELQEINFKIFNKSIKGTNSIDQLDLFNSHKKLREALIKNRLFKGNSLNSNICAKLLAMVELSHHINEELFY